MLRVLDLRHKLIDQVVQAPHDRRAPHRIRHKMTTLLRQRIFGIALGYEDTHDHTTLRQDPALNGQPVVLFLIIAAILARNALCHDWETR